MKKQKISDRTAGISRREFGQRVAFTLAGGALAAGSLPASPSRIPLPWPSGEPAQEQEGAPLRAAAQAEIEAKLGHIEAVFGDRLREDQKKLLRRTVTYHVRMLEAVRPIPMRNGDPPATVLKLIEKSPSRLGPMAGPASAGKATRKSGKSAHRGS